MAKAEQAPAPAPEPVPAPTVETKPSAPAKPEEPPKPTVAADAKETPSAPAPAPAKPKAAVAKKEKPKKAEAAPKAVAITPTEPEKSAAEKTRDAAKEVALAAAKLQQPATPAVPAAPAPVVATEKKPEIKPSAAEIAAVVPKMTPVPPQSEEAHIKVVTRDGWLRPAAGLFKKPGSHQLMSSDKPLEAMLLCFLASDAVNLDQYEGKHVRITGGENWQKGWNQALIKVSNIELLK